MFRLGARAPLAPASQTTSQGVYCS